ncbi:uncharacterized protein LOC115440687 isoform X1 [Manduca sexta]|uniref:Spaetzle domain-containing protein n=1 Tax=Manduca sexta TaxID=7130 RepID=A0A921YUJ9_MANSE|nr:uncharacterized protein LOC115440687 isoform X1 [Manduca sexta]KAG6445811.1 hypothetical protein O3G_MSEX004090 [Manduca sexta]
MYRGLFVILAIGGSQAANAASAKKTTEYVPIKYPGPIQQIETKYGTDEDHVPEQCKNKNFCTIKPADYPQEQFNAMFKGTAVRRTRDLKTEEWTVPTCDRRLQPLEPTDDQKTLPPPTLFIEAYGDRQGDPDAFDNCDTEVTYEPLYKVRSARGQWHTVIQAPEENYIQKVRLETCKEVESSCFTAVSSLVPTITTFCKQKYSVWQVLVSDGNNGTEPIKVELPICCSCHYKMNDNK